MADSTQLPAPRPKRSRRLRLIVLLVTLALLTAVYLPLRANRADDLLMKSLLSSDEEGVRCALNNGADPDLPLRPAAPADHFGSLTEFVRKLLHRSLRPPIHNAKTVLMYAANSGDRESVTELLRHGANVNIRLDSGYSALLYAASRQQSEVLEALLTRGADIHVHDRFGETPLLLAAQAGQTQNVQRLLAKGEDIHETDQQAQTALSLAVENRREPTIQLLLAQGADERDLKAARFPSGRQAAQFFTAAPGRSTVTINGVTTVILSGPRPARLPQAMPAMAPLPYAAGNGSPALLKFLWPRTDANTKRQYGWNIVCSAVQSKSPEVVRFALEQGLPVNPPKGLPAEPRRPRARTGYDPSKVYTPLHYAAALPEPEIAGMLIAHGANVNAEDMFGTTPLLAAVSGAHLATVRLLIEHGANVGAVEHNSGQNALMRGVRDVEIARLLLDHGLDVHARDHAGRTALLQCYSPKVAALLVERGADVNARDAQGNTPLLTAVRSYQPDYVTLLLKHGANVNSVNNQSETPLSVARTMRAAPLAALLTAAGAKR